MNNELLRQKLKKRRKRQHYSKEQKMLTDYNGEENANNKP